MKKFSNYKMDRGITLIALVVTIIILLILVGVSIASINGQGLLARAKNAAEVYNEAAEEEEEQLRSAENFLKQEFVRTTANNLSQSNYNKVKAKYLNTSEPLNLLTVDYVPEDLSADTVTIPSTNNGGVSDQDYTQANTKATGESRMSWYVLNVDANNLVLISSTSGKEVKFKGADGYNNCLYYLDQISKRLFKNENLGVTASRVHSFRLTDLRDATKALNNWSESEWEASFVTGAPHKSSGQQTIGGSKTYTSSGCRYYPALYGTSTGSVDTNNELYDETPNNLVTGRTSASSLTVRATYFGYHGSSTGTGVQATKDALGNQSGQFGKTAIADELFKSATPYYWIASRCIDANSNGLAYYGIRRMQYGYFYYAYTYNSCDDGSFEHSHAFRTVVSVPASHVLVESDGTVSIVE